LKTAEKSAVGAAHDTQIPIAGKFLIETRAAIAVDTTIHLMLQQGAQILIGIGSLMPLKAPDTMSSGNCHILQQAVTAFITNRAIMGMVEHQPFDHMFAKVDRLIIGGRYDHAVLGISHAAHLNPFQGSLQKFNGTNTASTHGSQGRMITKPWDHNAKLFRGLDYLGPGGNFYFTIIDD
jgi:hypothetical protein